MNNPLEYLKQICIILSPTTGQVMSLRGKMFTKLFETNQETQDNGRTCRINRVYNGGQLCMLRVNDEDE